MYKMTNNTKVYARIVLRTYKVPELRKIAKEKNLKGYSYVNKNDLIEMIVHNKNYLDL